MNNESIGLILAMEYGFRACEKGLNLEKATQEFGRLLTLLKPDEFVIAQNGIMEARKRGNVYPR